jgi:hypothetical protein
LEHACAILDNPLRDTLFIPGCVPRSPMHPDRIHWRFCGGFCVVPYAHVTQFFLRSIQACSHLAQQHKATWEVNLWASIEHLLPIQWEAGDHNDSMFANLDAYRDKSSFSTIERRST